MVASLGSLHKSHACVHRCNVSGISATHHYEEDGSSKPKPKPEAAKAGANTTGSVVDVCMHVVCYHAQVC